MTRSSFAVPVVAAVITACGGGGGTEPQPSPPPCPANTICMTGGAFYTTPASNPPGVSVLRNTPVAWTNTSGVFHNVTFANSAEAGGVGGGAAGNIGEHASGTNSRQFATPGTKNFQCTLHLNMTGVVVVQ